MQPDEHHAFHILFCHAFLLMIIRSTTEASAWSFYWETLQRPLFLLTLRRVAERSATRPIRRRDTFAFLPLRPGRSTRRANEYATRPTLIKISDRRCAYRQLVKELLFGWRFGREGWQPNS